MKTNSIIRDCYKNLYRVPKYETTADQTAKPLKKFDTLELDKKKKIKNVSLNFYK